MSQPERGFPTAEFRSRVQRAQAAMARADIAALLLTTEPDVRYFSGFQTRFWESPTRPWYLIVPASGDPVAVIPSIGAALMARTWIRDIRTWQSPNLEDDGISLLADSLRELVGRSDRVGVPMGHESHVRMPMSDYVRLTAALAPIELRDDDGIVRGVRIVKSPAEIEKISMACRIANRAFDRVHEHAARDIPLDQVFRHFQVLCLEEGADWVPYLAGAAAPGGYDDVISPASSRQLYEGDVLMLDVGLMWDGYFCDFDRNFFIGVRDPQVESGFVRLKEASDAAMAIARPGATAADLFLAMDRVVADGDGIIEAGRLGHGLGMQLTEWPSLIPTDGTILEEGMVLALEPYITLPNGRILVHEEDIVIRPDGARYLSKPAAHAIPVID
jgi:Xaa-Pro aminopeptidase